MKYKVITGFSIETFEKEIEGYLMRGWKLQGGIVIHNLITSTLYAQTIVKED